MPSNSEVRVVRTSGEEDVTTIPADAPDGRLLLCYWNMRCLAQPIRLALEYVCCDFVDVRLDCEEPDPDDSSVSKRNWFRQKAGLRLPFGGNLPFLLDGENGARVRLWRIVGCCVQSSLIFFQKILLLGGTIVEKEYRLEKHVFCFA